MPSAFFNISTEEYDVRITEIVLAQRMDASPGYLWEAYSEKRSVWGVTCILSGKAMFIYSDGYVDTIQADEIAVIPPTTAYRFFIPEDGVNCNHYTINFITDGSCDGWFEKNRACIINPADSGVFQHIFNDCIQFWNQKNFGYKMFAMSCLYRILYLSVQAQLSTNLINPAYSHVLKAQLFINENYQYDIKITQLAEMCNLSETHFRRLFKSAFNATPMQYIRDIRIEKAKDFLKIYDSPLEMVSEMCGFKDCSYFIRCFRQYTGMTPYKYRKKYFDLIK